MKRLTLTLATLLACAVTFAQEIPAYYFENGYLEGKIEKIKQNIESAQSGVTFPYITDGHWRDNGKMSFPLIKHIGEQVNMPFTVYGGDNIFAFGTKDSAMEEAAATEAKLLGSEIAQDLLAYIYNDKRNGNTDLAGIDFKGSVIFTTPMQFNGWWPTEVTFNEIVSRHLCVNPEKYNG